MNKIGNGISISAALVLTAGLAFGGYTVLHGAGQHAAAATYTAPVADSVAAPTQDMTAAQSIYDQQVAQAAADAAAQAAALKAAQDAAAAAAAPQKVATSTTYAPGQAPKGTPLPFTKSSDPQNALGGDYTDPGLFCASHSGSTVNGVPECD